MAKTRKTAPVAPISSGGPSSRRVFAYLRVSTTEQDLAAQRHGIIEYAKKYNLQPLKFVEETASGTVSADKRVLGISLLPELKKGDVLIVAEISRLGRRLVDILSTLKTLAETGVSVHVAKQDMRLDESLNSKILTTVMGLAAEIERELISQRTKEGQAKAKANGRHIGRPRLADDAERRSKLDARADEIKRFAAQGVNKTNLARIIDCNWLTLHNWLTRHSVTIRRASR